MAAPSWPCGDPASAAGHEDVHDGVEAMTSDRTGGWQQEQGEKAVLDRALPLTGTGVIPSSSSAAAPGPMLTSRRTATPAALHPPGRVGISAWFWPAARIRQLARISSVESVGVLGAINLHATWHDRWRRFGLSFSSRSGLLPVRGCSRG
jgi:hypothetical protein